MDIFGTAITAGGLVLEFVKACAAYSDDAKSLAARLQWDLRALTAIDDHLKQRLARNSDHQLSADDQMMLETAEYLDSLISKAKRNLEKIKSKGLFRTVMNRGMWIAHQTELKEMEHEIFTWTQRFDVHVLGLPQELQAVIPASSEEGAPAIISSHDKLRRFLDLPLHDKVTQAMEMRLKDSSELAAKVASLGELSFLPITQGDKQLVLASRNIPSTVNPQDPSFHKLESDMGLLAAALSCLDPAANVRLLRVESFFYHEQRRQFLFTQVSPHHIESTMTLEEIIQRDPFPEAQAALDQRLKLAMKLSEAVFFLHTAGFVHKNITSSSIVALQRTVADPSSSLDDSYLMGFNLIRGTGSITSKEGAVKGAEQETRSIWDFDIFQHHDRLCGRRSLRYTETYDIYSLGVILLEIGLWEPLREVVFEVNEDDPSMWAEELLKAAATLSPRTGLKYQEIVTWCIGTDSNEVVKNEDFVKYVLNPLEKMVKALC